MRNVELLEFPNPSALAAAAAKDWWNRIAQASGLVAVALSGGRVAGQFFQAIAACARENPRPLRQLHFFWADERCVPPTDPESNFRLAREYLFDSVPVPDAHIHRIEGERDPADAARRASDALREIVPAAPVPLLDFIFLGMGEDGHVASLFPGAPPVHGEIYYPVTGPKPPPRRITISYELIGAARNVWVLASGAGKEHALRESLAPGALTPLARVVQGRPLTRIFCDFPLKSGVNRVS